MISFAAEHHAGITPRGQGYRIDSERSAISSLPFEKGGDGVGSRPPPDRFAVDLPLSGGGFSEQDAGHISGDLEIDGELGMGEG